MKKYEELRIQFDQQVAELKTAIANKDFEAINRIEGELKDTEKEYRDELQLNIFGECRDAENPMLEAVTRYSFETISHKMERDGKLITGVEAIYDKVVELDIVKFTKFAQLNKVWILKAEKLNQLMCLQVGKDLGVSSAQIQSINKDFGFGDKAAKDIKMGKNPLSNNQMTKTLQAIIDDLVFVEGSDSKSDSNKFKANNHDVAYLRYCYTSRSKRGELTVKTAKNNFICQLIVDIAHRLITGKVYSVEFKIQKKKEPDEPAKVSTPAPIQPAEPETITVPAPTAPEVPASETIPEDTLPSLDQMEEV